MKRTKLTPSHEEQMLALELLRTDGFISIYKRVLSVYGPEFSVYLGNLISKYQYFIEKETLTEDGGFFLTYKNQCDETGMSEYQLRKCKNQLKYMGILITQMRDIPPKEYYFLNFEKIVFLIKSIPQKTSAIFLKKLNDNSLKNFSNIPIYNKIKYKKNIKKDFLQAFLPKEWLTDQSFQEIVQTYIQHRKEKNKPITPKAGEALAKKLAKYSKQVAKEALKLSIENGWTGVFPESVKGSPKKVTIGSGLTGQLDDVNFD